MQEITVNDQTREYKPALGGTFSNEVKKGNATSFATSITPSTNVPETGSSEMLRKTTGGSGTLAGSQKIRDVHDATDTEVKRIYNSGIFASMTETGDITHLGDLLSAQVADLTANSCEKLRELLTGVHDG
jgi:phosphate-selective porin